MKKLFSISLLLSLNGFVFCQIDSIPSNKNIEIIQDFRIEKLNDRYKSTYQLKGFRVQIYSDSKPHPAKQIRARFKNKYPDIPAYSKYEQPYYKVKVGDFKTKLEALKFKLEITETFPYSLIVKDVIKYEVMSDE